MCPPQYWVANGPPPPPPPISKLLRGPCVVCATCEMFWGTCFCLRVCVLASSLKIRSSVNTTSFSVNVKDIHGTQVLVFSRYWYHHQSCPQLNDQGEFLVIPTFWSISMKLSDKLCFKIARIGCHCEEHSESGTSRLVSVNQYH